jgi:ankyrin repeat protein
MLSTAGSSGLEVTKCLVEHGADVNAVSDSSGTGQHNYISVAFLAAERNHFDIMSYLVEEGANPNAISGGDTSLLMFAIGHGNMDSVKFLVKHGADMNLTLKDFRGRPQTALTFAQLLHHGEEVEYLEAHGAH